MVEVSVLSLGDWLKTDVSPYFCFVSEEERRERLERYRSSEGRSRSLFAELFARWQLAQVAGAPASEIEIVHDDKGKPFWKGGELSLSLSHSGGYIAVAVGHEPVGVDVECRQKVDLAIARRWFRDEEYAYLAALDPDVQRREMLRFWTLKESALKRRGEGLAGGLETVDCRALIEAGRTGDTPGEVLAGRSFLLPDGAVLSVVASCGALPQTARRFCIGRAAAGVYGDLDFEEKEPTYPFK